MSNTIICPTCSTEIEITEVMSAQLAARIRSDLEGEMLSKRQQLETQAEVLRKERASLEASRQSIDEQVGKQLATERNKLMEQARQKATEDMAVELRDRDEQLREAAAKLKGAQEREVTWRKQERDLKAKEEELNRAREEMEDKLKERLAAERVQLTEQARKKAAEEYAIERKDREEQIKAYEAKLKGAQEVEVALRKKERAIQERMEELELTVARRLAEERDKIRSDVLKKAAEEHQLRDAEKDKKIADLIGQIDEMKRKAEQGSTQTQGEVLEIALEGLLRRTFTMDEIAEVPKGIRGADVVQRVMAGPDAECGTILWEAKRTRNWSDQWLTKLRQDQRDTKAAVAIIVSSALPSNVDTFALIDGVWVCSWSCAMSVATALRAGMLEVAQARRALAGRDSKLERVYHYLSSVEFRNRVGGIVEAFVTMKADLDREKAAIQRQWAKREKQIDQAVHCTAGLYGDFQGIIGSELPEIEGMSLPQLEADD